MTVTVAVPFFGRSDLVDRAVRSVLAQTYRDLVCVVIGDGQEAPLSKIRDSRLVVYNLPENRGTYFATAVALGACDTEWFTIHAADDWSEPDRFARLMAHTAAVDAVFGGSVQHEGRHVERRRVKFGRGGQRPRHVGSIATGLYRTAALKGFEWWSHPEFRVAYDSMMVNLVLRHLRWVHVPDEFGYHREVQQGSLTRSKSTGLHSEYRRLASQKRAELWERHKDDPAAMLIDPLLAAEVREHARRLREQLA